MHICGSLTNKWMQSIQILHELMKNQVDSGHGPLVYAMKSRLVKCLAHDYELIIK
ncbi:hypothetical protein Hanom_Chr04g00352431 [Helianthus anomalus]